MIRILRPQPPYDGTRLLQFVGAHAVPGVEHWDGHCLTRSVRTPHGPVVAAISTVPMGLRVELSAGMTGAEDAALPMVRHLLAVDVATLAAERDLAADAVVGPSVRTRPGLRTPGSVDDGETLVRTVVGQQVSLAGARTVLGRIVAVHGELLPAALQRPGVSHLFPDAAGLAGCDPLGLPLPRARARAVVVCADAVARAGALPPRADLLALTGVGPWTADYVELRCRLHPDVFLPTDLAVRRSLERVGVDASAPAVAERALGWAPYRSTALIHLWTTYLEESGRA